MASQAGEWRDGKSEPEAAYDPAIGDQVMLVADSVWTRLARIALYVAIFFSGWALLRVGSINLTLADLAFAGALFIFLARGDLRSLPFGWMTPFWLVGLVLMLGGLLFSTLVNGDVSRWIVVAGQYLLAFLLIPMVLMGQETSLTRRLPAIYVAGIALSETIGIASTFVFTYSDVVDIMGDGFITGNGRLGAMTGEPNPNGAVIAFALPMLVYCVRTGRISPLMAIVCAVPLIWGLLASGSFTGFSASVVAVGIVLAVSGIRLFVRVALAGIVAGGLFVASGAPLPAAFEERVAGAVSTGDLSQAGTFTDRSVLIQEAWERAESTLIVGVGVDRYREVSHHGAPVHELHLLIWNEGGVFAFLGLVILLACLVAFAFMAITRNREEGAMILAVVAVFMVYTLSIPHMYSRQWIMPVMLALSTVYAMRPLMQVRAEFWKSNQ